jgi:hypothetical protein
MEVGYLYVRGVASSLFWGTKSDVGFFSRSDLTQIDLGALSTTRPATQAVIPASMCSVCGTISFKAFPTQNAW